MVIIAIRSPESEMDREARDRRRRSWPRGRWPPSATLGWKFNKPGLNLCAVSFEPDQELCRRLVRILPDWVDRVACFQVNDVSTQAPPDLYPFRPKVVESVHNAASHHPGSNSSTAHVVMTTVRI